MCSNFIHFHLRNKYCLFLLVNLISFIHSYKHKIYCFSMKFSSQCNTFMLIVMQKYRRKHDLLYAYWNAEMQKHYMLIIKSCFACALFYFWGKVTFAEIQEKTWFTLSCAYLFPEFRKNYHMQFFCIVSVWSL